MNASAILQGENRLYLICDGETCARQGVSPADFVAAAAASGAAVIQYRHKGVSTGDYARNLALLRQVSGNATLIVNDHATIAEAERLPLHLGQSDLLPPALSVPYGRSTHSMAELEFALAAHPAPDYVALGTMFGSPTKPDVPTQRNLIATYLERTPLRLVLIGGITLDNVAELPRSRRIYYAVITDAFRFGATPAAIGQYVQVWRNLQL